MYELYEIDDSSYKPSSVLYETFRGHWQIVCGDASKTNHDISLILIYTCRKVGWEKDYVVKLFGFTIICSRA